MQDGGIVKVRIMQDIKKPDKYLFSGNEPKISFDGDALLYNKMKENGIGQN